ncbi:hypothetical protein GGR50DRAFT_639107 [Xylaria sp. CBS 124048]|nr:hypothetical protein GGR50DRAFT_639107 [Xylaria sp. CBS 124048]
MGGRRTKAARHIFSIYSVVVVVVYLVGSRRELSFLQCRNATFIFLTLGRTMNGSINGITEMGICIFSFITEILSSFSWRLSEKTI